MTEDQLLAAECVFQSLAKLAGSERNVPLGNADPLPFFFQFRAKAIALELVS